MNPGLQMSVSAERFVARGSVQTPSSAHSSAHGLKKTFWKSLKSKRKKKWRAVQRHRKRLRTTPALNPWARERPHEPRPFQIEINRHPPFIGLFESSSAALDAFHALAAAEARIGNGFRLAVQPYRPEGEGNACIER